MCFDLDLTLRRDERTIALRLETHAPVVALIGRSGAGKTSVLDAVAGLLRPVTGRIVVAGRVLFDAAAAIDLPPRARRCGYVFQDGRLFPHLDVRANLTYGWRLRASEERRLGVAEVADFLGIAALLARRVATLSGGEARRVAIGRALLASPDFLALDEPLAGLDAARRGEVLAAILRLREAYRLPMLYVSHDAAEIGAVGAESVAMD